MHHPLPDFFIHRSPPLHCLWTFAWFSETSRFRHELWIELVPIALCFELYAGGAPLIHLRCRRINLHRIHRKTLAVGCGIKFKSSWTSRHRRKFTIPARVLHCSHVDNSNDLKKKWRMILPCNLRLVCLYFVWYIAQASAWLSGHLGHSRFSRDCADNGFLVSLSLHKLHKEHKAFQFCRQNVEIIRNAYQQPQTPVLIRHSPGLRIAPPRGTDSTPCSRCKCIQRCITSDDGLSIHIRPTWRSCNSGTVVVGSWQSHKWPLL